MDRLDYVIRPACSLACSQVQVYTTIEVGLQLAMLLPVLRGDCYCDTLGWEVGPMPVMS